jgi:hypothetical protein
MDSFNGLCKYDACSVFLHTEGPSALASAPVYVLLSPYNISFIIPQINHTSRNGESQYVRYRQATFDYMERFSKNK